MNMKPQPELAGHLRWLQNRYQEVTALLTDLRTQPIREIELGTRLGAIADHIAEHMEHTRHVVTGEPGLKAAELWPWPWAAPVPQEPNP